MRVHAYVFACLFLRASALTANSCWTHAGAGEEADKLHRDFNHLCLPETHAACHVHDAIRDRHACQNAAGQLQSPQSTSDNAVNLNHPGLHTAVTAVTAGPGQPDGDGRVPCPRVDFGRYLLQCAHTYGGCALAGEAEAGGDSDAGGEEEEEGGVEEREVMVGQVKAMLLSDWELGCTWYHGVGTAPASAPAYFDQAEPE